MIMLLLEEDIKWNQENVAKLAEISMLSKFYQNIRKRLPPAIFESCGVVGSR
jgi:hypothetical protein